MFTGLIEETGEIIDISTFNGGVEFVISGNIIMSDLAIDHSVSVNGACQTVIEISNNTFRIQSIKETLDKIETIIGQAPAVNGVNPIRGPANPNPALPIG